MTEYTSLDVSKRLAEAGFRIKGDSVHWEPGVGFTDPGEHIWRYRSDTLLEWLGKRGMFTYLAESSIGFHVSYALTNVGLWTAIWTANVDGQNLPDALGEVVLAVLAKEATNGKQG